MRGRIQRSQPKSMKKILLFGNSHLGCIKNAIQLIREENPALIKPFDLTFSGHASHFVKFWDYNSKRDLIIPKPRPQSSDERPNIIMRATAQRTKLSPLDRARSSSAPLDTKQFDAILIFISYCKLDPHLLYGNSKNNPIIQSFSTEILKQVINTPRLPNHKEPKVYAKLIKNNWKKILFVGQPLPHEEHPQFRYIDELSEGDTQILRKNCNKIRSICETSLTDPCSVKYYLPPEDLLCSQGVRTKSTLMRGVGNAHANEKYGEAIIKDILKKQLI